MSKRSFLSGFAVGIALGVLLIVAFPHAAVPPALQCGMRTLDGCAIWFSPDRIARYKRGEAGQKAEFVIIKERDHHG